MAYDTTDPLPALAVINSTAQHVMNFSKLEYVIVASSRGSAALLTLLRSKAIQDSLPPTTAQRVKVCDGFSKWLIERPALAALVSTTIDTLQRHR